MIRYVDPSGRNTNTGAQANPWQTISFAATQITPGDIVRVQAGTYNERVGVNRGGSSGNWVSFVADGRVVCLGFALTSVNYVRVIGFEVTHTDTTYKRGITIGGTCSHIEILDNNVHDVYDAGIIGAATSTTASYVTIRGNRIYWTGHPGAPSYTTVGVSCTFLTSNHWLVEYNEIERSGDFTNCYGNHHILRNNHFHDYADAYWTSAPNTFHSDMFQPGSDGYNVGTHDHVYEANFCGDSIERNSHFGIWQDTTNSNDRNILIRGNVAHNFGGGGIAVISTKQVKCYNNTFFKFCQQLSPSSGGLVTFYTPGANTNYSTGNLYANTLISDGHGVITPLNAVAPNTCTFSHNLGYQAGTNASYVSTADPLFVDPTAKNFRLQGGSPAIAAGTNIVAVTSADGSGTSFDVDEPLRLCDGFGMVDGDTVTIGGTNTKIVSISGNTVTVANSVTWTTGMPVYWGTNTMPDIGALPFASVELTGATLSQVGNDYTVSVTGDARGVWFYVDGIPTTWVSEAPYTATIASGTVTAKAYALYAQAAPVIFANSSSDATLSALTLSTGTLTPAFVFSQSAYTAAVSNATTSVTVTPTASAGSTITVNGAVCTSGSPSASLPLAVGDNTITIVVTNGSATQTYSMTVNRAADISSDATLASLVLSSGTLSPAFTAGTNNYTATVANDISSLIVTPTTANGGATVKVNGTTVVSGNPSGAISLFVGNNTIVVVATAANGTTIKIYIVTVTRAMSGNADLAAIDLSDGTLVPDFYAQTLSYTASTALSSIDITPTLVDVTASVKVNSVPVTSGSPSSVALNIGANVIPVLVTAQNGVQKRSNLIVTRTMSGPSTDARLLSLIGDEGSVRPPFNPATLAYAVGVPNLSDVYMVTPTAEDAGATITVNGIPVASGSVSGDIALGIGPNGIVVIVTAEDDVTTRTYTLTVWRSGHGRHKVRVRKG